MMYELRASAMPGIMACPGRLTLTEGPETEPKTAAIFGTAVHTIMEWAVQRDDFPAPAEILGVAVKHGIKDTEELTSVARACWTLWRDIEPHVAEIKTEVEMTADLDADITLRGHADVIGKMKDGTLVVIDWKTSREPGDYAAQLQAYGVLANATNAIASPVKTILVYGRLWETQVVDYAPADIVAFRKAIIGLCKANEKPFAPGTGACIFCRCKANCQAWQARQKQAAQDITAMVAQNDQPPENIEKFFAYLPLLNDFEKAIARAKDFVRDYVKEHGEVTTAAGTYYLKPENRIAFPLTNELRAMVGDEVFAQAVDGQTISQSALKKLLGKNGKGVMDELTGSHLARITTIEKLTMRKGEQK